MSSAGAAYQPKAAEVKALRDQTGLPMMDCKKALAEAGGDVDQAKDILRKQVGKIQDNAAGRETTQGRIDSYSDESGKVVAVVQMQCEQAPSAKNDTFVAMTQALAHQAALATTEPTADNLLDQPDLTDPSRTARHWLDDAINLIRENITLARVARLEANGGTLGKYVHFNFQEAAIVRLEGQGATPDLANNLCMHIVAAKPSAISRGDMPSDLVEKERQFAREQAAEGGKPENLIEKIAEGKVNAWFAEKVLLEQQYVKDPNLKVADLLKQAGDVTVTAFQRFKIGE